MSRVLLTCALGFVPIAAHAQATDPPVMVGAIDFGLRGTTGTGEAARYERYRNLSDGLFLEGVRLSQERKGWQFDLLADHVARTDQRYIGTVTNPGKFKGRFVWDQIPMLMSSTTQTLFTQSFDGAPGVMTIDPAFRAQVQASPAATPNVAVVPALFEQSARAFDTRSRRHITQGGFEYIATPDLTVRGRYQYTDRLGVIPYGGSFGHSSLVEFPAPIKHTMNDFESSAEFSRDALLVRAGYVGSWFNNANVTATFDNPFRTYDTSAAPSLGRVSLPPSNSVFSVNGLASVKLPHRTRVTAYVSVGALKDVGDPIMPQTVNSVNTPAPLERTMVEGEARTTAVNLNFVSRPNRLLDFSVRYRSYDYDNRTPEFAMTQRVSYDNAPGVATMSSLGGQTISGPVHTEPFGVIRHTFDADVKVSPMTAARAGVGYSRVSEERNHRVLESTVDNVLRLSFDSVGNQWFSLRTKYEHAQRRGDVTDEAQLELFNIGEQPGIRHFDIASRDRDRVTILGSVTPSSIFSVNASIAAGKDDYTESLFGLRDNTHRVYSAGMDLVPTEFVTLSGSYSYERYEALSRSRQASPPSGSGVISYATYVQLSQSAGTSVQVADASRNWATDGADRVHSFILTAGVTRIAEKVDLQVSYDTNRSRALYNYITGPVADRTLPEEVVVDTTLPPPTQLPLVKSNLQRGMVDVIYALTSRVSLGVSFWHERYDVTDFTLDLQANPELARGQALLLGYLYEPYTANTVWGRIMYRW